MTRALPLVSVESWQAWKLCETASYPIAVADARAVDEAVAQALGSISWRSGDILAVQQSHDGRHQHTLWQFQVKQSSKRAWRRSYDGGPPVPYFGMEAKPICQTALAAPFAPVEPFDALRDDAVGLDRTLVEVRS